MPRSSRTLPPHPSLWTAIAVVGVMFALFSMAPTASAEGDRSEPTPSSVAEVSPAGTQMPPEGAGSAWPTGPGQMDPSVVSKSEASPFDGWLTALGAVIVGVLSLIGVLLASGRTAKSLIAAEATRHKNDLDADRERRRAAAQFELYVSVARMMRRLASICVDIELGLGVRRIPSRGGGGLMLHIAGKLSESTESLKGIGVEIEQSLEEVDFLGSESVYKEVTQAYAMILNLQVFAFNIDTVKDMDKREKQLAEVTESIAKCSSAARRARTLMRGELRGGIWDSDAAELRGRRRSKGVTDQPARP